MNAGDQQEIRQLFDEYLVMYASRDDRLTTHFSDDFSGFTGGGDFLVKDKDEWIAITRQDFGQVHDALRIELKDLSTQLLADTVAVASGLCSIQLPVKDEIMSRKAVRLVLVFRKESAGWKISHCSYSIPDQLVREGEVFPMEGLKERNQELEEIVAERTLQLSESNSKLQQTNDKLKNEIDNHKQAEIELRKSHEQTRLFFEHQIVGMAITAPDKTCLQVNDQLCRMLGYSHEELAALSWEDFTYQEDLAKDLEKHNSLLSGEINGYAIEKRFTHKDGTIIHANLSVACVRNTDDSVDYLLALYEDISANKRLELKRKEDQRFLQTILDSISDFIFYKDKNSIFLGCNEAYASRYIGLQKDQIIGHPHEDFIQGQGLANVYIESDRQVINSGRPLMIKNWITLANGQKIFVEVLKAPFFDTNGEAAGVIGVARDITEHHLALEAVTREKETTQRYLDIAAVMFGALNRSGDIILINKKGSEILGYNENELLGQNWLDVCLPEHHRKRVKEFLLLQLTGELAPVEFYENTVITKNGEERLIAFNNTLMRDENGISGVLFSGDDITERRRNENELMKSQKLESLGVLAGGIAHDFNNILTGIMGNISFARKSLTNPEKAERLLGNAEKASQRASALASQLLTFAKGGEPIKKRVFVGHILEETLALILRGTNVKGVADISTSLRVIEADEGQLNQVFNNLVINAVQAMPKGGLLSVKAENITLKAQNKALLPPGEYVRLLFSDQGAGIAEDNLRKIFDPYYTTKSGGNGLGLASASSIIKRHNGYIGVTSTVGEGTIFQIYLPSIDGTGPNHQADNATQKADSHSGGSLLIMDDEKMILDILSELLEFLGYQVTTCENGEEAVEKYKAGIESREPFSAVIMDLTIPGGIGGKEAAEQILAIDPTASLIVSSGYSNDLIMSDYSSYGFIAAVTKPYNISKLSEILSLVINKS